MPEATKKDQSQFPSLSLVTPSGPRAHRHAPPPKHAMLFAYYYEIYVYVVRDYLYGHTAATRDAVGHLGLRPALVQPKCEE